MFFIFSIKSIIKSDVFTFQVTVLSQYDIQNKKIRKRPEITQNFAFDFVGSLFP